MEHMEQDPKTNRHSRHQSISHSLFRLKSSVNKENDINKRLTNEVKRKSEIEIEPLPPDNIKR